MKRAILLSIVIAAALVMISHAGSNQQPDINENSESLSVATFAGGCFWCTESDFEKLPGVAKVISGFSGRSPGQPQL
jgi:peptide methionine sulfoxide reductase msrA/msrB